VTVGAGPGSVNVVNENDSNMGQMCHYDE
jgi:hypothetical protein